MNADPMVEWLRAALDHVERVAREAEQVAPAWMPHGQRTDTPYAVVIDADRTRESPSGAVRVLAEANTAVASHAALHDPRAVLTRVEAERTLVDWCDNDPLCQDGGWAYTGTTLRWLAYSHRHDYPGFDPTWAPEGVTVDG